MKSVQWIHNTKHGTNGSVGNTFKNDNENKHISFRIFVSSLARDRVTSKKFLTNDVILPAEIHITSSDWLFIFASKNLNLETTNQITTRIF